MSETNYGMEKWRGKVALVTGASSGIGRAAALALAGHGMRVAVTARRLDRLDELERELVDIGAEVLTLAADFTDATAVLDVFERVRSNWGGVDVLINNAGLGHRSAIADGDTAEWRAELDVNVFAASLCMREAVRDMESRGGGQIINLSSIAGQRVPLGKDLTMYSATKHALQAVSTGLWGELAAKGSAIKIGMISPGSVETEWHAMAFKSEAQARALYDSGKPLSASDIVEAMRYMLSAPAHVQINEVTLRPITQKN